MNGKVIAVIGPNEAGKSSLLEALEFIENDTAIPNLSLTRDSNINPNEPIISVKYKLDVSEKSEIKKYDGEGKPKWLRLDKMGSGKVDARLYPEVSRDVKKRAHLKNKISK